MVVLSGKRTFAETVPIPSKRPAVMNVSPSFIEELKNREQHKENSKPTETDSKKQTTDQNNKRKDSILPLPPPPKTIEEENNSKQSELVDLTPVELLKVLGEEHLDKEPPTLPDLTDLPTKQMKKANQAFGKEMEKVRQEKTEIAKTADQIKITKPAFKKIPIPKHKPVQDAADELNNIETSAGTDIQNDDNYEGDENTTLVSFALKPEQIKLDPNLEMFLQEHALKLFHENKNMRMEIQAYATSVEGEQHSDVRISLARALEVRSFLIKNKIQASRLKLNPMGTDKSNATDNRIDLLFISDE